MCVSETLGSGTLAPSLLAKGAKGRAQLSQEETEGRERKLLLGCSP